MKGGGGSGVEREGERERDVDDDLSDNEISFGRSLPSSNNTALLIG